MIAAVVSKANGLMRATESACAQVAVDGNRARYQCGLASQVCKVSSGRFSVNLGGTAGFFRALSHVSWDKAFFILSKELGSHGTLNQTMAQPETILRSNQTSVIISHNF